NNADQVNQLMLGSSSSSQLQMSDSYRLVINGGKSMEIPLKARNNSSLSLNNLTMSILPNDGSLVASTSNTCGATLLGRGYCTNNYTYTAPNATTHEQKLYSLVYGNTSNNGNNSTGTLLGVDVYPTGGFIPSNALTNLIPGASGNVVVENGVMYVATLGLSISKDNGQTWQTVSAPEIADPSSVSNVTVSGDDIYVSTYAGLSLSHDGGKTWQTKTTVDGLPSNSVAYVYASGDDVYLATNAGLAISTDKGATWATKTTADGLTSNDVRMVTKNNGEIYLTTRSPGGVSFSTDGGTTWTTKTVADGILNDNRSIYVDGNKIYVGGYQGYSVSTNNGSTWTNSTLPQLQYAAVYGIYADGDDIFLASGNGISVSHDDGVNWTLENSSNNNLPGDFTSAISKVGNVLYAGTGYALAKSTDNGNSWQVVYSAPGVYADRVSFINNLNGTLYAGTISTGLYISKDDGVNWQNYNSKNGLSSDTVDGVWEDANSNTLYLMVGNGQSTINYSRDNGKTWTQVPKATFNSSANGVYTLGSDVFVPTYGGLVKSTDNGNTWSAPDNSFGSQLYGISGEGDNIYLFGNHGLWVSTDGGTNWTKKYNPATYFGSQGGVFVSGQNVLINTWNYGAGKPILLISTDGGNNWVSKTAVDLGMPAGSYIEGAIIANGTIYVATWGFGVIYSTDGGNTWLRKTTDDGLQANMVYRINADASGDVFLGNVAGFSIMKVGDEGILIPE
ncbi:YCF48-related protein, partial [Cysteiniphilum sp. 19S12-1]